MPISNALVEEYRSRFLSRVVKGSSACWDWVGTRNGRPGCEYGRFHFAGVYLSAHRFSYLLHVGDVRDDLSVLHRCDNPLCVNPRHLWLGSQSDNMRDMALKKRSVRGRKLPHTWKGAGAKGEKHHRALLRETQVRRIRAEYAKRTISQQELADRYEVSRQAVGYIVRGESWRHLTDRGVA